MIKYRHVAEFACVKWVWIKYLLCAQWFSELACYSL